MVQRPYLPRLSSKAHRIDEIEPQPKGVVEQHPWVWGPLVPYQFSTVDV